MPRLLKLGVKSSIHGIVHKYKEIHARLLLQLKLQKRQPWCVVRTQLRWKGIKFVAGKHHPKNAFKLMAMHCIRKLQAYMKTSARTTLKRMPTFT